jgi:glucose/arabinose dehydrogenase
MKHNIFTLFLIVSLLGLPVYARQSDQPALKSQTTGIVQAAGFPGLLELEQIITGLSSPVAITNAGDGSGRLFITLQGGKIVIFNGTQILATPFLDISSLIACCGERGLLSTAFHPNYQNNGYFYVNYTRASDGATVVARYSVSSNPNVANPASALIIITIAQDAANHNGGQLQFGPDGYLYIGMGDGGGGGDPNNRAQNPASLLGKLLRIDVDGGSPYAIPADNPFVSDSATRDEIWAFGLRNPWRFSFDRATGDLIIADVGQNAWEEIDFQPASSAGGENYGWSCYEGTHTYDSTRNCTAKGTLKSPVLEYSHSLGCSVTGGYRYRGSLYPALKGVYLYADFCSGIVWGATQAGSVWSSSQLQDTSFQVSTFGEDEGGELYLADYGGGIYKIKASSFADVSTTFWAWNWIETLYSNGVTAGCGTNPLRYCPGSIVTRDQMAVFLLRGEHGSNYTPPPATGIFEDVPVSYWAAPWIEQLYTEGVTEGCSVSPLLYCPTSSVTRSQMAVFLLKAKHGSSYTPPPETGIFGDVPSNYWAVQWIEQLYHEGITVGCSASPLLYCPDSAVGRDQMAVFLTRTYNLTP